MEGKQVQVYFPMTIPATGKTFLFNNIEQFFKDNYGDQAQIFILASDMVSLQLMEEYQKKDPKLSKEEAYAQTRKQYRGRYEKAIHSICQQAQKSKATKIVIIFDKNHPENALKAPLEIVKEYFPNFISIALIPKVGKQLGQNIFSITYLVSCVQRAIKRNNHETLVGTKEKVAAVVLFFFSFFNKFQVENLPLKKIFYVPFTNEDEQMDQKLREETLDLLKVLRQQKNPEEMEANCKNELQQLIAICEKYDLGFPELKQQQQVIWDSIKSIME